MARIPRRGAKRRIRQFLSSLTLTGQAFSISLRLAVDQNTGEGPTHGTEAPSPVFKTYQLDREYHPLEAPIHGRAHNHCWRYPRSFPDEAAAVVWLRPASIAWRA